MYQHSAATSNRSHNRHSTRLPEYDYSRPGLYFITICTNDRLHLFGKIVDRQMILNDTGSIVQQCWMDIPLHFPQAMLGDFVVMPNHVHGIIILPLPSCDISFGVQNIEPLRIADDSPCLQHKTNRYQHIISGSIGSIVRGFKIGVTKWVKQRHKTHPVWQRNYWDHVIRNKQDHFRISQYICNNPASWNVDKFNNDTNCVSEETVAYGPEWWMI